MAKTIYEKMDEYFKKHEKAGLCLKSLNILSTLPAFVMYPLLVGWLFLKKDRRLTAYIMIPGASFLLVSIFRRLVNRPRPYEAFGKPAVIKKEKKGRSFPSRHVFSSFLIALIWLPLAPLVGLLLLLVSLVLAIVRVIGGVHYISDVLAGALAGIVAGLLTVRNK